MKNLTLFAVVAATTSMCMPLETSNGQTTRGLGGSLGKVKLPASPKQVFQETVEKPLRKNVIDPVNRNVAKPIGREIQKGPANVKQQLEAVRRQAELKRQSLERRAAEEARRMREQARRTMEAQAARQREQVGQIADAIGKMLQPRRPELRPPLGASIPTQFPSVEQLRPQLPQALPEPAPANELFPGVRIIDTKDIGIVQGIPDGSTFTPEGFDGLFQQYIGEIPNDVFSNGEKVVEDLQNGGETRRDEMEDLYSRLLLESQDLPGDIAKTGQGVVQGARSEGEWSLDQLRNVVPEDLRKSIPSNVQDLPGDIAKAGQGVVQDARSEGERSLDELRNVVPEDLRKKIPSNIQDLPGDIAEAGQGVVQDARSEGERSLDELRNVVPEDLRKKIPSNVQDLPGDIAKAGQGVVQDARSEGERSLDELRNVVPEDLRKSIPSNVQDLPDNIAKAGQGVVQDARSEGERSLDQLRNIVPENMRDSMRNSIAGIPGDVIIAGQGALDDISGGLASMPPAILGDGTLADIVDEGGRYVRRHKEAITTPKQDNETWFGIPFHRTLKANTGGSFKYRPVPSKSPRDNDLRKAGYADDQRAIIMQVVYGKGLQPFLAAELDTFVGANMEQLFGQFSISNVSDSTIDVLIDRAILQGTSEWLASHGLDSEGNLIGQRADFSLQQSDADEESMQDDPSTEEIEVRAKSQPKPEPTQWHETPSHEPTRQKPFSERFAEMKKEIHDRLKPQLEQQFTQIRDSMKGILKRDFREIRVFARLMAEEYVDWGLDIIKDHISAKLLPVPGVGVALQVHSLMMYSLDKAGEMDLERVRNTGNFSARPVSGGLANARIVAATGYTVFQSDRGLWYKVKDPNGTYRPRGNWKSVNRRNPGKGTIDWQQNPGFRKLGASDVVSDKQIIMQTVEKGAKDLIRNQYNYILYQLGR